MNEAETRAELIDPKIKEAGWGEVEGSFVRREFKITNGEIKPGGIRAGIIKADYVLIYKNRKLAVIEAKSDEFNVSDGVSQAKDYAQKLKLLTSYSSNGHKIYEINYSKNKKGEMFITSEGEFNESICTLLIPDLKEDSPPFVAIYYKRDNSQWFTESLYRKRLRFNFKDGVLKLDQSNFWDWFEIAEIKIVVIY